MLGPVYSLELRLAARRAQKRPWRWLYSAFLFLAALILPYVLIFKESSALGLAADGLIALLTGLQLAAILLIAPAFAAGSIADEKRRGMLDFLLTTPLSSGEIVLGKWLGQTTQVFHLISPAYVMLPLLAGAIGDPAQPLFVAIALQIMLLYAVVALGLFASALTRSTAKAIVSVYIILGSVLAAEQLLGAPVIGPSLWALPGRIDVSTEHYLIAFGSLAFLALVCLVLGAWCLRPAHERQQSAAVKAPGRWWDRPPIADAPMRWKERFVGDWFSIPLWRILPRWLKCILFACGTAVIAFSFPHPETFVVLAVSQFLLSGLFVAVRAAGAITDERENQTWDSLLTTHLDMYQIVRGKLWGQIDALRPYLLAYIGPALVGAILTDWFAAFMVIYAWIASWVFLYYFGAVGISCSATATSTWRSVAGTLISGMVSLLPTVPMLMMVMFATGAFFYATLSFVLPAAPLAWILTAVFAVIALIAGSAMLFAETEARLTQAEKELTGQRAETGAWPARSH